MKIKSEWLNSGFHLSDVHIEFTSFQLSIFNMQNTQTSMTAVKAGGNAAITRVASVEIARMQKEAKKYDTTGKVKKNKHTNVELTF